ncbi:MULTISPECIES: hypothetical protein [unclassified Bradyrhizobium]
MRRTVIGGETLVIWDGLRIGRIFKSTAVGGGAAWSWSCALPNVPQRSKHRGQADSLRVAKAALRCAWGELYEQVSNDELRHPRDRPKPQPVVAPIEHHISTLRVAGSIPTGIASLSDTNQHLGSVSPPFFSAIRVARRFQPVEVISAPYATLQISPRNTNATRSFAFCSPHGGRHDCD